MCLRPLHSVLRLPPSSSDFDSLCPRSRSLSVFPANSPSYGLLPPFYTWDPVWGSYLEITRGSASAWQVAKLHLSGLVPAGHRSGLWMSRCGAVIGPQGSGVCQEIGIDGWGNSADPEVSSYAGFGVSKATGLSMGCCGAILALPKFMSAQHTLH